MFKKSSFYPLIIPSLLILVSILLAWQWPIILKKVSKVDELKALLVLIPLFPYVLFAGSMVLGWRFNNGGMVLSSLLLGLVYLALPTSSHGTPSLGNPGLRITDLMGLLVPLNIAFFSTLTRRRILTLLGIVSLTLILAQVLALAILCQKDFPPSSLFRSEYLSCLLSYVPTTWSLRIQDVIDYGNLFDFHHIPTISIFSFLLAALFLCYRYYKIRDSLSAGFIGILVATFMGLLPSSQALVPSIYFSCAALILLGTTIETSFSMAYMDELTGLPGRRSLNETLINLGRKYAIAMIDIDFFKKFNDRYGHRTGDQVLMMIASKLKELTGGAKVFRYGGEEFTAVFPGKTAREAFPHLDTLRKLIETTPFTVRGRGRKKGSPEQRGKLRPRRQKGLNVTVSIGVASSSSRLTKPEKVLKAADKLLYRAKKNGRNRVEW
ncbi:MAG: GGDEF domain-containing protein [Deltaproteobacteria bacterium]|nr:GGDEF domain-containing protein [Deltaproteobacteria bacterium]